MASQLTLQRAAVDAIISSSSLNIIHQSSKMVSETGLVGSFEAECHVSLGECVVLKAKYSGDLPVHYQYASVGNVLEALISRKKDVQASVEVMTSLQGEG